jgi:hypothetical protein
MGSYYNGSYAEFLDSLKAAGVVIRNESEVRERLAESQRWRTAFMTLAANGRTLGSSFRWQARVAIPTLCSACWPSMPSRPKRKPPSSPS